MKKIHTVLGDPPARDFTPDFSGLIRIVVGQQLSTASASAIWGRVRAGVDPFDAAALTAKTDDELRAFGLSRPKVRTIRAISDAVSSQKLDIGSLASEPDDVVMDKLTALHGIGPWTAEIFLLFAMQRPDVFPSGDLALQLAAQSLFDLEQKPAPKDLTQLAERWRPWRGLAAHLLWSHYSAERSRP